MVDSYDSESVMFPAGSASAVLQGYDGFTLLHSGTYADVYRASRGGRYFLLKAAKKGNPCFVDLLRREYEVSAGLDHPNIAAAFTIENVETLGLCLVMEYVDGMSLEEYLKGRPSVRDRKRILHQLLSAVAYLHARNIIHNDLKSGNILVSRQEGNLKLIDFGLSDDDAHYLAKTLGCTPDFASPELLAGKMNPGVRSDIYSIGKIISLIFPHRYFLIVRKCLRTNPQKRFGSVDELKRGIALRRNVNLVVAICLLLAALFLSSLPFLPENEPAGRDTSERELCCARLDSLYEAYVDRINAEPYRLFSARDVTDYAKEFEQIRDRSLARMDSGEQRDELCAYCRKRWESERDSLVTLSDSRPGMDALSVEEIDFYLELATSGQPYRPYCK